MDVTLWNPESVNFGNVRNVFDGCITCLILMKVLKFIGVTKLL